MKVQADGTELAALAEPIDQGLLKPAIAAVFPLAEAAKAHAGQENGTSHGKVVLTVRD